MSSATSSGSKQQPSPIPPNHSNWKFVKSTFKALNVSKVVRSAKAAADPQRLRNRSYSPSRRRRGGRNQNNDDEDEDEEMAPKVGPRRTTSMISYSDLNKKKKKEEERVAAISERHVHFESDDSPLIEHHHHHSHSKKKKKKHKKSTKEESGGGATGRNGGPRKRRLEEDQIICKCLGMDDYGMCLRHPNQLITLLNYRFEEVHTCRICASEAKAGGKLQHRRSMGNVIGQVKTMQKDKKGWRERTKVMFNSSKDNLSFDDSSDDDDFDLEQDLTEEEWEMQLEARLTQVNEWQNKHSLREHPIYHKYFKMMQLGIPIEAVKNGCEMDGNDSRPLDLDPMKSLKSQLSTLSDKDTAAELAELVESGLGDEEEEVLEVPDLIIKVRESFHSRRSSVMINAINTIQALGEAQKEGHSAKSPKKGKGKNKKPSSTGDLGITSDAKEEKPKRKKSKVSSSTSDLMSAEKKTKKKKKKSGGVPPEELGYRPLDTEENEEHETDLEASVVEKQLAIAVLKLVEKESEIEEMRQAMQSKDEKIAELQRRIESLEMSAPLPQSREKATLSSHLNKDKSSSASGTTKLGIGDDTIEMSVFQIPESETDVPNQAAEEESIMNSVDPQLLMYGSPVKPKDESKESDSQTPLRFPRHPNGVLGSDNDDDEEEEEVSLKGEPSASRRDGASEVATDGSMYEEVSYSSRYSETDGADYEEITVDTEYMLSLDVGHEEESVQDLTTEEVVPIGQAVDAKSKEMTEKDLNENDVPLQTTSEAIVEAKETAARVVADTVNAMSKEFVEVGKGGMVVTENKDEILETIENELDNTTDSDNVNVVDSAKALETGSQGEKIAESFERDQVLEKKPASSNVEAVDGPTLTTSTVETPATEETKKVEVADDPKDDVDAQAAVHVVETNAVSTESVGEKSTRKKESSGSGLGESETNVNVVDGPMETGKNEIQGQETVFEQMDTNEKDAAAQGASESIVTPEESTVVADEESKVESAPPMKETEESGSGET